MNMRHCALPDRKTTKRTLPYNRQYVILAIYEVLDKNGAGYKKEDASTILSEISVYGNLSLFSVSVSRLEEGTELSVTMVRQCEGLSESGVQRAITAVADSISQYLENELVLSKIKSERIQVEELPMKRIGEYFAGAYKNAIARWIFGITASLVILPDLIKTVLLCIKKESLAAGTVFIADVLCVVCAFVFAFFAVCSIGKTAKEAVAVWLKGCIPCIAALYGGKLLTVLFVKCFGTVGEFIGIAAGGILLGLSFYLLSCAVNGVIKGKVGRKLLLTAVCILLAIVFAYLLPYIFGLCIESTFAQKRVWCIKLIAELVYAVFCQALIVPVLKFVCFGNLSKAGTDEQITSAQTKKSRLGYILTAVGAAVLTICAVMTFPATVSPSDRLKAEYYSRTNTACYNLLGGNIITAVNDYREIQRELEIWEKIADGGWNDISESEIATNQMLAYLDTYANHTDDRLETMEKYYTAGYIKDTDFCFDMLAEYKNADELTAEQKNRRTEILTNLAAKGIYVGGLPDVAENAAVMAEVIETAFSYQNSFEYAEMLAKMRVGVTNGTNIADSVGTGITYQFVSQAVEKALEAPEDFVWSYIAVMFYNNQEQHSHYLTADY